MPKMKTHRGAAKRFKMHRDGQDPPAPARTVPTCSKEKSSRRTRRLGRLAEVTGGDRKRVKRLLGK